MARKRLEGTSLQTWEDVNLNLKEIAECELAIEVIENKMNQKIHDLKLDAEMKAQAHQERIKVLAAEIKEFSEYNRDDFKGKTKTMNFGSFGFRKSTKIVYKNAQAVLEALKARRMSDCIKTTETILKDKLKEYSEEDILAVGANKRIENVFWYETDREKLKQS
ncbi:host-nuclease inhibitor Gam family protein [Desulforamulus ruminis]|uniref:Prophage MuMc02, host-nuclease inhibitor protein n=1 Tax=Desulforamulus ruminis (strain ATCC 23193 / DSM 2154 / NCIMB 8452 / DL) TaxID=696281 RepID=F6DTH2_DESRL|nr:host-nuclease inhibitor Gam family protein [Desulforamulus ruminis]AEG60034.1 prophage MuMc02, host-nuclease inhibitor protein [Desulforamulus ruminis DSM 2154]